MEFPLFDRRVRQWRNAKVSIQNVYDTGRDLNGTREAMWLVEIVCKRATHTMWMRAKCAKVIIAEQCQRNEPAPTYEIERLGPPLLLMSPKDADPKRLDEARRQRRGVFRLVTWRGFDRPDCVPELDLIAQGLIE